MMKTIHMLAAAGFTFAAAAPVLAQPAPTGTQTVQPDGQDELQWAASVVQMSDLDRAGSGIKLFGTAGGDPAMNGVQTYLAFYQTPADGYRIFRIGDFLNWAVLSQAPGRVVLSIRENFMPQNNSGNIGTRWRRLTISWRSPATGEAPRSISMTSTPGR